MIQNIQQIIDSFKLGVPIKRLSKQFNVPLNEIKPLLKDILIPNRIYSKLEDQNIIDMYKNGTSAKKIAIIYKMDRRRVFKILKSNNIELRPKNVRFVDVNENAFEKINNEYTAYWLGFLYADGYNNEDDFSVALGLQQLDHDHVVKFANFLQVDPSKVKDFSCFNKKFNKTSHKSSLVIHSKKLSNDLARHGCVQAKSLILKFPQFLDPKLHNHFIRGYFDGDGSLCVRKLQHEYKFNLAGTNDTLTNIKDILKQNINAHSKITQRNKIYLLDSSGNMQIKNIMDYLYKDATIYLERKYLIYKELCDWLSKPKDKIKGVKITDKVKQEIINRFSNGESYSKIGYDLKIERHTISKIIKSFNK